MVGVEAEEVALEAAVEAVVAGALEVHPLLRVVVAALFQAARALLRAHQDLLLQVARLLLAVHDLLLQILETAVVLALTRGLLQALLLANLLKAVQEIPAETLAGAKVLQARQKSSIIAESAFLQKIRRSWFLAFGMSEWIPRPCASKSPSIRA